jgi:branched-chain amino acid transport system substrate-binding protein
MSFNQYPRKPQTQTACSNYFCGAFMQKQISPRVQRVTSLPLALACLLLSFSGLAIAAPNTQPIRIAAISTLSGGPAVFAPSGLAAKAYFDEINATGGIQNRKIVFVQEDDKGNPQLAAQAAAKLVGDPSVVAFAGGASLMECAVNAKAYVTAQIVSIPGMALDGGCFKSPMIAPVNAGPVVQMVLAMRFATEKLRSERLCVLRLGKPANIQTVFDIGVANWSRQSGLKLAFDARDILDEDLPEKHLALAVNAKCDALVFGGPTPFSIRYAKAAAAMMGDGVPLLFLGSVYSASFAEALAGVGGGKKIYAMSEFEPWSSRSGSLSNWRTLLSKSQIPLTSNSQGGYTSAQVMVHVLRSIRGEINRESVTRAFMEMGSFDASMLGMPFQFGKELEH